MLYFLRLKRVTFTMDYSIIQESISFLKIIETIHKSWKKKNSIP